MAGRGPVFDTLGVCARGTFYGCRRSAYAA
jgi:hypothetical protein